MSLSTQGQSDNERNKENNAPPNKNSSSQIQRPNQRTVLGALSINEQYHQTFSQESQLSKHSSISESPQLTHLSYPSTSSNDVYIEEAFGIVIASYRMSSGSVHDASNQFELNELLTSEEVLCVSEYAEHIYWHMREIEITLRPQVGYLDKHPQISESMRAMFVDWMVKVTQYFKFHDETLHLAVDYLNRFLSRTSCMKLNKLQLLSMAALWIAAKYEEINPPDLGEFVDVTDSTCTKRQFIQMEYFILHALSHRMAAPTIQYFLRQFMLVQPLSANTENLALYLAELSLLEVDPFLQYTPSQLAAAAYCLANYTVNKAMWPGSLQAFTMYVVAEFVQCMNNLHVLYKNAENLPQQAIRKKYSSSKYGCASLITAPAVLPLVLTSISSSTTE